jgi:hypothetical protein
MIQTFKATYLDFVNQIDAKKNHGQATNGSASYSRDFWFKSRRGDRLS